MYCQEDRDIENFQLDKETQAAINKNWEQFIIWRPTKVNASLCRFIKRAGEEITIVTDVTYKDVVGLRWRKSVNPDTVPFRVVTAMALLRTKDGQRVLVPRDSGDWEPALECPGGFIRAPYLVDGRLSVDNFIRKRVQDDVALKPEQIAACNYVTTYDAKNILEYMLVYEIVLSLSRLELQTLHPQLVLVPPDYTPERHHEYTALPIHRPSAGAFAAVAAQRDNWR